MQDYSFAGRHFFPLSEDEKKLKQIIQHVLLESGILPIPAIDGNKKYDIRSEVE